MHRVPPTVQFDLLLGCTQDIKPADVSQTQNVDQDVRRLILEPAPQGTGLKILGNLLVRLPLQLGNKFPNLAP